MSLIYLTKPRLFAYHIPVFSDNILNIVNYRQGIFFEQKEVVRGFSLAADSSGNAHVAYGSSITSDVRQLRYARIPVKLIDREPAPSESDKPAFTSVQGRVVGKPLSKYLPRRTSFDRYFFPSIRGRVMRWQSVRAANPLRIPSVTQSPTNRS